MVKPHTIRQSVPSRAEQWFAGGERIGVARRGDAAAGGPVVRNVFVRREGDLTHAVTFLPGFPDGSFGWANVLPYLPSATEMPKLFVEYLGMGDSDKPQDERYSTAERTDLVEALWRRYDVRSTTLVAFDFSSLVVLEHLRRRLERVTVHAGVDDPVIRGAFIFNGGLFPDGHSHPWYTTPLLRRLPLAAARRLGQSRTMFKLVTRIMWSKTYAPSDAELAELATVLDRRDGFFYLAAAAGFVADHQAQGDRLNFAHLYEAYRDRFPFFVGGSDDDPFEHRQVTLAAQRLGAQGLRTQRLPGGHLTTSEQPAALARLITQFEAGISASEKKGNLS